MLSSICFMPASLTPQSLPPGSPIMATYLSVSTVVMCMRAGLYQTKNGLLVFFGSLRSRKSMTLAEISSSTAFERSSVSGPWSLHVWFFAVPSATCTHSTGRGGVRQIVVFGSTAPGTSGEAGDRRVLAWRRDRLLGRGLVDVGEAHALHRVEVIEVAPEFLEAVRGRQRVGVVAEMVLAELAGVVAEIEQELGDRRRAGPQIGRAAGQLRRDHAGAQRMHAGEEGVAARRAALLGVVVHEHRAFVADAIDVRRLADHQAAMVDARLHPADVVAHDEEDIGLSVPAVVRSPACWPARTATSTSSRQAARRRTAYANQSSCVAALRIKGGLSAQYGTQHDVALPVYDASEAPRLMHRKPRWLVDVSTGSA